MNITTTIYVNRKLEALLEAVHGSIYLKKCISLSKLILHNFVCKTIFSHYITKYFNCAPNKILFTSLE